MSDTEQFALEARDRFGRMLAGAWGSAEIGGEWALTGPAADFSVSDGFGRISITAGQTREARLPLNVADIEIVGTVRLDRLPGGGNAFVYILARANGNTSFRVAIRVAPNGSVHVQLRRAINNSESAIAAEVNTGLVVGDAARVAFRLQVDGTALRFRIWIPGFVEPDAWQTSATDTTEDLQGPGAIGIRAFTGGSVPNGPLEFGLASLHAGEWVPLRGVGLIAPATSVATPTIVASGRSAQIQVLP